MNLITQLPDHIIHYILSLLRNTKDAARTSILSKRWRELWTSFSILKFDQQNIQEEGNLDLRNENFKDFVDNSLKRHLEQKLSIRKLISTLLSRKTLPRSVFAAKTLTGLRLYGCKLNSCGYLKLPHLQKLYMRQVILDQQAISNLISGCPLVEDLRFIHCTGLKDLQVSGLLKLDRFEMHHFHGMEKVEITAPNLLTFWYCGSKSTHCEINLVACASLKRLTLVDANMTDEVFQDRFASFPVLEKLELSKCNQLKNITISSTQITPLITQIIMIIQASFKI
ncbi:F-box/LRR-repeat protein 25-like [Juglans microcarpa x Juglans regia]|uniref:F-box/LRR-repeat protein 25-like n=1 Tax=Juglans microcarpa x Juglans regia TaxID=2249226 RepID=UPI001B7DE89F|nr:F-box/LRR-repeat protein 25-like [Juglans microcarpa x Juglans regia]